YGGLYREVELIRTPKTYIRDLFVYLVPDGNYNRIAVRIAVEGESTTVDFTLAEAGVHLTLPIVDGYAETSFVTDIEL
ncbi:hypothetical protein ACGI6H_32950, partial [Escherichia coli]